MIRWTFLLTNHYYYYFEENQQTFHEDGVICNVVQYEDYFLRYQKMKTATLNNNASSNVTEHYFIVLV